MTLLSFPFLIFLSSVYMLYWFVFNHTGKSQNFLLYLASLLFYFLVNWHYSFVLIFNICFNFYLAKTMSAFRRRTMLYVLILGVLVNIGILGYFKYQGFFYPDWISHPMLPLGISFYTFQAIAYLVDVYQGQIKPRYELLVFATYMSYFPKMTAGPIEPDLHFFDQIEHKRTFDYLLTVNGLRQILWGLFAKLVIANNCALVAAPIFSNYRLLPASTLMIGAFFYLFQVYGDFSGYSNIAIGISKLFGIDLVRNFASPFFSVNIREFWRKWNMSLSSWMMKYVFYPLSFSLRRLGKVGLIVSVLITFLIIGLWHGTSPTFIVFGLLHGLYFIPGILYGHNSKNEIHLDKRFLPAAKEGIRMISLFFLVMLTIIVFGTDSVSQALNYWRSLFSLSLFTWPFFPQGITRLKVMLTSLFIIILLLVEWIQIDRNHEMQIDGIKNRTLRWGIYYAIFFTVLFFGSSDHIDFIYSQF